MRTMHEKRSLHTALTDACIKDFCQHFVVAGLRDGIVVDKVNSATELGNGGGSLCFWDRCHWGVYARF